MITVPFGKELIKDAEKLAIANYNEERTVVPALPAAAQLPPLDMFASNGLGVAAFDGGDMIGFLCCFNPRHGAFGSSATGVFSPIHAHGAVKENRGMIYKRLYQAAAEIWVGRNIGYHAIALYSHDSEAVSALFSYGFGLRCVDAVREMERIETPVPEGISFRELAEEEIPLIRNMRVMLTDHLGQSPCFMYSSPAEVSSWLARAESRASRLFAAFTGNSPVAFIEVADDGENFATESETMKNICGAFCLPHYRGTGTAGGLLDYLITVLGGEGVKRLGVDFESFNPTAQGFWLKYFSAYTGSLVRRIDECALSMRE